MGDLHRESEGGEALERTGGGESKECPVFARYLYILNYIYYNN